MRKHRILLSAIVFGLLTATANAQAVGEEPRTCRQSDGQPSRDYEHNRQAEWPTEAQRLRSSAGRASRREARLRLVLDGGRTIELVDCPFGDGAYWYLYDRFDAAGRFHVVRRMMPDDLSYALVNISSGRTFTVHGVPVWASDKSRFLTVACSLQPQRGRLLIQAPGAEGLMTEAEIALPCESESCSARWDHSSWISVTCVPREEPGRRGKEFVVMRSNDGTWKTFGR